VSNRPEYVQRLALERLGKPWMLADLENRTAVQNFFKSIFDRFLQEGLADREFTKSLATGNGYQHEQRRAELLLAAVLWRDGFTLESGDEGPDFRATKNGQSVWLELVTPEPIGIDAYDLTFPTVGEVREARRVPHAQRSLRWTAAFSAKAKQMMGDPSTGKPGYRAKGIVPRTSRMPSSLTQPSFVLGTLTYEGSVKCRMRSKSALVWARSQPR